MRAEEDCLPSASRATTRRDLARAEGLRAWMRANLTTQGFCLSEKERRELALGLRFSTGVCMLLVAAGLALQSPPIIFALAGIGLLAGFTPRHPFDLAWNHGIRRLAGGPALPANPVRRRHAFKIGTAWLLLVATLLAAGATIAALLLGALLLAACTTVTATNLCLPSEALAWLERRSERKQSNPTRRGIPA